MTIGETLQKNQPKEYQRLKKRKRRKRKNEKLSEKDIKELMGHSSYRRGSGGAIKQVRG